MKGFRYLIKISRELQHLSRSNIIFENIKQFQNCKQYGPTAENGLIKIAVILDCYEIQAWKLTS